MQDRPKSYFDLTKPVHHLALSPADAFPAGFGLDTEPYCAPIRNARVGAAFGEIPCENRLKSRREISGGLRMDFRPA